MSCTARFARRRCLFCLLQVIESGPSVLFLAGFVPAFPSARSPVLFFQVHFSLALANVSFRCQRVH